MATSPVFWSSSDVKALIAVWKEKCIQDQLFNGKRRNFRIYIKISKVLKLKYFDCFPPCMAWCQVDSPCNNACVFTKLRTPRCEVLSG